MIHSSPNACIKLTANTTDSVLQFPGAEDTFKVGAPELAPVKQFSFYYSPEPRQITLMETPPLSSFIPEKAFNG
jgi:hypothetical protein